MRTLPEYLCQTKDFSCFGCCGHDFESEGEVYEQVKVNTEHFRSSSSLPLLQAESEVLSKSGICHSVIKQGNRFLCGLHPQQHDGTDNRDNKCEKEYFCKTMKHYKEWNMEKRKEFLHFVNSKKPTPYEYSLKMVNGSWLEEFNKIGLKITLYSPPDERSPQTFQ